jgi:hypothetical protein
MSNASNGSLQLTESIDSSGNSGFYMKKSDLREKCGLSEWDSVKKQFDKGKCSFDVTTRGTAAVSGVGAPIHTLDQEHSMSSGGSRMWGACIDTKTNKQLPGIRNKHDCERDNEAGKDPDQRWAPDVLVRDDDFSSRSLSSIIDSMPNGRVPDVRLQSNVYDKVTKKNITRNVDVLIRNDNQDMAIKGLVEETALSQYFLSPENTQVIQDTLRYRVFKRTKVVIDYQSPQELFIVMRSVLLQHGNLGVKPAKLSQEIRELNSHVLKYCVNEVSSNVKQYEVYLKDIERMPYPMDRPQYTERNRMDSYDLSHRNAAMSL